MTYHEFCRNIHFLRGIRGYDNKGSALPKDRISCVFSERDLLHLQRRHCVALKGSVRTVLFHDGKAFVASQHWKHGGRGLSGIFGEKIGMRRTVRLLLPGYFVGYGLMSVFGAAGVLMTAFFLVGIAKGNALNTCTVLVGNHAKNRARSVTAMHCCYAAGALLCPFFLSALQGILPSCPSSASVRQAFFSGFSALRQGFPWAAAGSRRGQGKRTSPF